MNWPPVGYGAEEGKKGGEKKGLGGAVATKGVPHGDSAGQRLAGGPWPRDGSRWRQGCLALAPSPTLPARLGRTVLRWHPAGSLYQSCVTTDQRGPSEGKSARSLSVAFADFQSTRSSLSQLVSPWLWEQTLRRKQAQNPAARGALAFPSNNHPGRSASG